MADQTYTRDRLARMIECAIWLPSPGDLEVTELAIAMLALMDERDEARAEAAALRALLSRDGTAWGEHVAGLGDDLPTVRDRILSAVAATPDPEPGTEADVLTDAASNVRGTTTDKEG